MVKKKPVLDAVEFGNRVAIVREEILNMSQTELGIEIGAEQMMISRLERGVGGNINIIYKIVSFLHEKGYRGEALFASFFSKDYLIRSVDSTPVTSQYYNRLKLFTDELEEKNNEYIEELKNILMLISNQS